MKVVAKPWKILLPLMATFALLGALLYGQQAHKMDQALVQSYYQEMFPDATIFIPITDKVAQAKAEDGTIQAYLGVSSAVGYGGPIMVGTVLSPEGAISDVLILDHKETPSYLNKIEKAGYFRQYEKKTAGDALVLNYDIDVVSGATLSTRAIADSVQNVAHIVATQTLNITPKKAEMPWNISMKEIAVALLFVCGLFLSRVKKLTKYRLVFLAVSVIILGFWLNRSLSIAHIQAMFMGFSPLLAQNLIWYIVIIGALAPVVILGKNIYCSYLCPFCGIQELTHMVSRINIPISQYMKLVRSLKNVILFAVLFLGFLTLNPSVVSFEPFGTIFGLNGSSLNWYLLFVLLVSSFFFRRFWCYVFCPVGSFLDLIASWRRALTKIRRPLAKTAQAVPPDQVVAEVVAQEIVVPDVVASNVATSDVVAQDVAVTKNTEVSAAGKGKKNGKITPILFWSVYVVTLLLIILQVIEGLSAL